MVNFKNKKKYSQEEINNYDFLNENKQKHHSKQDLHIQNVNLDINIFTDENKSLVGNNNNLSYLKTRKADLFAFEDYKNEKFLNQQYLKRLEIKKQQIIHNEKELEQYETMQKQVIKSNFKF